MDRQTSKVQVQTRRRQMAIEKAASTVGKEPS